VLPIVAELPDEEVCRHGEVQNHEKILCVISILPCTRRPFRIPTLRLCPATWSFTESEF
jgi:hypothetical protein